MKRDEEGWKCWRGEMELENSSGVLLRPRTPHFSLAC